MLISSFCGKSGDGMTERQQKILAVQREFAGTGAMLIALRLPADTPVGEAEMMNPCSADWFILSDSQNGNAIEFSRLRCRFDRDSARPWLELQDAGRVDETHIPMAIGQVSRIERGHRAGSTMHNNRSESELVVRRIGQCLDICIGELPPPDDQTLDAWRESGEAFAILYRADVKEFEGDRPSLSFYDVTLSEELFDGIELSRPEGAVGDDEQWYYQTGRFSRIGDPILRVNANNVELWHAKTVEGRPAQTSPTLAYDGQFHIENEMLDVMLKMHEAWELLKEDDDAEQLCLPQFEFLIAFDDQGLSELLSSADFSPMPLWADIQQAVESELRTFDGRSVSLRPTLGFSGVVSAIDGTTIRLENGREVTFVAGTQISVKVGDRVLADQPVGIYPEPPKSFRHAQKLFGEALPKLVEEFVKAVCIRDTTFSDSLYLQTTYCGPQALQYAKRSRGGYPYTRLLMSELRVHAVMEDTTNVIVLPAMPAADSVWLGDLWLGIGEQLRARKQEKKANRRDSRQSV